MLIEYLFMCVITTDFHGHLGTLNKDSKNENDAMLQYSQQKEKKLCPTMEVCCPISESAKWLISKCEMA